MDSHAGFQRGVSEEDVVLLFEICWEAGLFSERIRRSIHGTVRSQSRRFLGGKGRDCETQNDADTNLLTVT